MRKGSRLSAETKATILALLLARALKRRPEQAEALSRRWLAMHKRLAPPIPPRQIN